MFPINPIICQQNYPQLFLARFDTHIGMFLLLLSHMLQCFLDSKQISAYMGIKLV
jgi:hypothetical protein